MFKYKYLLILFTVLFLATKAYAQSDDEVDLSYGGMEVPGFVSANFNFAYGGTKGKYLLRALTLQGNITEYNLPEIDVEVGIVDRLSLEIATGYQKIVVNADMNSAKIGKSVKYSKTVDGLSPVFITANLGILKEKKLCPAVYLQNMFSLPKTGYTNFQNEQLGFYPTLNFENSVSDVTYFDYSLSAGWDGNNPYPSFGFILNPNFNVTDNIVAYSDLSGFYGKDQNALYQLDVGTTITFSDLFSLDVLLGTQFQKNSTAKNTYGGIELTFDFNAFAK